MRFVDGRARTICLGIALAMLVPKLAVGGLVTWSRTDVDGNANGLVADLFIGGTKVGDATIVRSGVVRFANNPSLDFAAAAGVQFTEDGQANRFTHSATYRVSIDSVEPGYQFNGFTVRQYADATDAGAQIANPDYTLTFNTGVGSQGTSPIQRTTSLVTPMVRHSTLEQRS